VGPPASEPIGLALTRTARTVSRAFDEALAGHGASHAVWVILLTLHGGHEGTQRALAEAVGIEGPTLTHHLNRLEAQGLVTRTRDPANRRAHRVALTPAGEARFGEMLATVDAFDTRLRSRVSRAEVRALRGLLDRLAANVTD
jgi:MarR family transcriptional regulator, transcriptional regulator for hemolysin